MPVFDEITAIKAATELPSDKRRRKMKYAVCNWPDGRQMTTIVRVCRTLEMAKKVARQSDRLFVVPFNDGADYCRKGYKFQPDWGDVVYMIPQQNDPKLGAGRFGNGLRSRAAQSALPDA